MTNVGIFGVLQSPAAAICVDVRDASVSHSLGLAVGREHDDDRVAGVRAAP